MYYEEKIINGILYYRSTPTDWFRPVSIEKMSRTVIELQEEVAMLRAQLNDVQQEEGNSDE